MGLWSKPDIGYMVSNLPKLPDLDDPCGKRFAYRDFVECSATWQSMSMDNAPEEPNTYVALRELAILILDPVSEHFGPITLTYGVATPRLIKKIRRNISPRVDQHSSYELSEAGRTICCRGGAACDFVVSGFSSLVVAQWIVENTKFDRLYYYGVDRPVHVSAADEPKGQCVIVTRKKVIRQVLPRVISTKKFLTLQE